MRTSRLRLAAARLLAAFAGVVVAVLVCELGLRAYEGDPLLPIFPPEPYVDNAVLYAENPTRLYGLRAGVDEVVRRERVRIHVNADGIRDDRELVRPKPARTFRAVILGDSYTFGGKVQAEDTFSAALERELRTLAFSPATEAMNFGVPGYNTEQEMLLLKETGLAYEPDLVIVNFVLNDAAPMQQLVPLNARVPLAARKVLKRFDLVQRIYNFTKRMGSATGRRVEAAEDHPDLGSGRPGWERARAALAEIQRLSAEHHARLMVVVWPMLADMNGAYPDLAKHLLVVAECDRLAIPVFDLLPVFKGLDESTLWASWDDHHPNALALAIAAKAVSLRLAAEGLVPVPGPVPVPVGRELPLRSVSVE